MLHAQSSPPSGTPSPFCKGDDVHSRLKVGLLLDIDGNISASNWSVLEALLAANFVEIVQVFEKDGHALSGSLTTMQRLMLSCYKFMDNSIFNRKAGFPGSRTVAEVRLLLANCVWTFLESGDSGGGISDSALGGESSVAQLDVIVCLTVSDCARLLSGKAKYGVWWIAPIGNSDSQIVELSRLRSVLDGGEPLSEIVWALRASAAEPVPLERATYRPISLISVEKNINPARSLHGHLFLSALRKLAISQSSQVGGSQWPLGSLNNGALVVSSTNHDSSSVSLAVDLTIALARQARHRLGRKTGGDFWRIGIRAARPGPDSHLDSTGYSWSKSPTGSWCADPFLIEWKQKTWLFFEEISDLHGKASIACAEVYPSGVIGPVQVVLKKPYHLSYPQVFALGADVFMLPESGTNQTVDLYRAVSFPDQWELVRTLHHGSFFDTSMHFQDGRFWFFSSLIEDSQYLASQLLLFSSDRIDGDWKLHPANPISADARFSRGAGSLFHSGLALMRPAQDCSKTYGGAIRFRRIIRLNEREYQESEAGVLGPSSFFGASGVHTYNRSSGYEVIDQKGGCY